MGAGEGYTPRRLAVDEEAPIPAHPELAEYRPILGYQRHRYAEKDILAAILHSLIVVASELRYTRVEGIPVDIGLFNDRPGESDQVPS